MSTTETTATVNTTSKTKTITIEITFECSATLNPTTAKVCCGIVEKKIKNAICGIQAQTELSPLLSVDDLVIQKEIGRGSYGICEPFSLVLYYLFCFALLFIVFWCLF